MLKSFQMATSACKLQLNQSVTVESKYLYEIESQKIKTYHAQSPSHSVSTVSPSSANQIDEPSFALIINGYNRSKSVSTQPENSILIQYGYDNLSKICDTLHGELYECTTNRGNNVSIKRTDKSFIKGYGMIYCAEEDIVKEAGILHYLTVQNRPTAQYIVQYIDFIESNHNYYLITELTQRNINLKQFITKAHQYISCGKLRRKEYYKMIKYIFWQIFAVIQWLHVDMHCCHLNLKLEHIIVENANFIYNKRDGYVHINPSISPKICDFGRSEVFKQKRIDIYDKDNMFRCNKPHDVMHLGHLCTDYDARSADIWSLGMMLYHCYVGVALTVESGSFVRHSLRTSCINPKIIDLMCNILKEDESERFSVIDILKHPCFEMYYQKYKKRIAEKSKTQKLRLMEQRETLKSFPYYHYHKKVSFV